MRKISLFSAAVLAPLSTAVWAGSAGEQQALDFLSRNILSIAEDELIGAFDGTLPRRFQSFEVEVISLDPGKPQYSVTTVMSVYDNPRDGLAAFFQGRYSTQSNRDTINLGFGQRLLLRENTVIVGANAFYDYEFNAAHSRMGLGGELLTGVGDVRVNGYWALSGDRFRNDGSMETALDGYDAELAVPLPYLPTTRVHAKTFKWYGVYGHHDLKGQSYSLRSELPWGIIVEVGTTDYNSLRDQRFFSLSFNLLEFNKPGDSNRDLFVSPEMFAFRDVSDRRFEKVRRENRIIKQVARPAGGGGTIVVVFEGV
ncbi:MAG: inverse autotransporter beta domain-containing protein [Parvibaculum sp.]|nr:inverse autotransporter beta domain-containing protein [Parvibaculum sp.]